MELIALRTFLAVVEEGSMLLAAEKLNTVQSNVTARIKKLEGSLNQTLFFREGKSLTLTPPGRELLKYAEQMLSLQSDAIHAISQVGSSSGTLKLGTMEAFASFKLPTALPLFREELPDVQLHIETDTSAALVKKVLSHQLDVAIVGGIVDHEDLITKEVLKEELVLVRAKNAVPQQALILFKHGCAYRASALNWMRAQGLQNYGLMELNTLDGILGCVSIGLGVTLMPLSLIKDSQHKNQLTWEKLPAEVADVSTLLIRHRKNQQEPILNTLEASFKERLIS